MEDLSILFMRYEMYYQKAVEANANDLNTVAKQNYEKAAATMYEIAQKSPKNLKDLRLEIVKKLILLSESKNIKTTSENIDFSETPSKSEKMKITNVPDVKFNDVIGLEEVKDLILHKMILPFKHPEKYKLYNKETGGGVLLYGPPGTGKTTIAKAIANEVGAAFYYVKGSDIMNKYVGESEKNISNLFQSARSEKLAIIFIDDMDSMFSQRGVDSHNDSRVNEFLQNMDGFSGKAEHVLFLGATNRPWALDSAVIRPGRFSRQIFIPLPNSNSRKLMIKKFLSNSPVSEDIDYDWIISKTNNFSGADLFELCEETKIVPLMNYIKTDIIQPISNNDFKIALLKVKSSIREKDLVELSNYNKEKRVDSLEMENQINSNENIKEDIKESKVKVLYHDKELYLVPGEELVCRFILSEELDNLTLSINNKVYACFKDSGLYKTEKLGIDTNGIYKALIIKNQMKLCNFEFEVIVGVKENNLGI